MSERKTGWACVFPDGRVGPVHARRSDVERIVGIYGGRRAAFVVDGRVLPASSRLTERQFQVLDVLARDPGLNRIAWSGVGHGSYGLAGEPSARPNALLLSIDRERRWPTGATICALERKGFLTMTGMHGTFYRIYALTTDGIALARALAGQSPPSAGRKVA